MGEKSHRWRVTVIILLMSAVWVGLGVRISSLHLGDHPRLQTTIDRTREVAIPLLVGRGRILDRNGSVLAADISTRDVAVDPKFMNEHGFPRFTAQQLSRLLELDPAMVFARIENPKSKYELLKRRVPDDVSQQIQRMKMPGVRCDEVMARVYPHANLMCHVVGFANMEGVGSAGIEQRNDRYLRGVPGFRETEVDGHRREVRSRRKLEIVPQQGGDVYLTLDQNLQYFVERALDAAIASNGAKGAWAIVQRVRTGEILAMASRPDFDLNEFNRVSPDDRLNRAIGYVFEPGSVFKIMVYAAALNEGLLRPDEIIDCENGYWVHGGKGLRDFHPYGRLSATDALKKSSNIAAAKVALRLGEDRLYRYLQAFGVGRATGVELPGEESGILHPRQKWSKLSITRIPMGHEVAVTGLQMLNALNAVANGGALMRPHVVQRIATERGQTIRQSEPEVLGHPIRPEAARTLTEMLVHVTQEGTGKRARLDGYTVAGKTGTAEKPGPGGYDHKRNIASFIGFLPAEQPELSILVSFDEPQTLTQGGQVAAPVFREIAEHAVRYLDIPQVDEARVIRLEVDPSDEEELL
ncbi:MAG: penicillin-binding protein 2 [Kiritimatiellae bacterium]|nr:penicillin-binding protein 2 [Kiritimatiellia bacterium]MCO5069088.1 penicillin-binding protein 2 [Kiritimatiellia bacterium]